MPSRAGEARKRINPRLPQFQLTNSRLIQHPPNLCCMEAEVVMIPHSMRGQLTTSPRPPSNFPLPQPPGFLHPEDARRDGSPSNARLLLIPPQFQLINTWLIRPPNPCCSEAEVAVIPRSMKESPIMAEMNIK